MMMEPLDVLPRMPQFDIYGDIEERRATKARMDDLGISLDVAYPFTLAGRTEVANFARALECAAYLGARYVNALAYDRDPARRIDKFGALCDLAESFGLGTAVEFFPLSQVRSLAEALELVTTIGKPGRVGVNVDLLHLMRSGGSIAELEVAPADYILYGQQCDGPHRKDEADWNFEAASQRLLAGAGAFDLAGFAQALPASCPVSVELPQDAALAAGVPVVERARQAVEGIWAHSSCSTVSRHGN